MNRGPYFFFLDYQSEENLYIQFKDVYTGFIFASLQLFHMEIKDCNLHRCLFSLLYVHGFYIEKELENSTYLWAFYWVLLKHGTES